MKRCVEFHGHFCPGLTVGYRAALAGLQRLGAQRASDEELIAIVENDSCAVDAVQVLAGCTFGKGNLFFRDYGKMVFTFALRPTGRAVRVALRSREGGEAPSQDPDARARWLLDAPVEQLFDVREMTISLPGEAEIRESVVCDRCGEESMASRAVKDGRGTLCLSCSQAEKAPVLPRGDDRRGGS
jgi:formylmethanofuran dehydrogenase subunit E